MKEEINMQDEYVLETTGEDVQVYTIIRKSLIDNRPVVIEISSGIVTFLDKYGYNKNDEQVIIKKPVELWAALATSGRFTVFTAYKEAFIYGKNDCIAIVPFTKGQGLGEEE